MTAATARGTQSLQRDAATDQLTGRPCGEKLCIDGTHRARTLEDTLAWVTPQLARFGITRVANVTGLDHIGIPVVMVVRPNGKSLSVSQGKGLTMDAAKASGIMESIEAHHAENIDLPVRFETYRRLERTESVVDVTLLPQLQKSIRKNVERDFRSMF